MTDPKTATTTMTHRERLRAVLQGEPTDRPAISLWRHFGGIDMTADGLTAAMLDFQEQYDFDFVKFMPPGTYPIEDWGASTVWEPRPAGSRTVTRLAVQRLEDWDSLKPLDVEAGFLGIVNAALGKTIAALGPDVPVLQTIFSPLSIAVKLAGPAAVAHLRMDPDRVGRALEVIGDVTASMIQAAVKSGADVFYAVQTGSAEITTLAEFQRWETSYAEKLLGPLLNRTLTMIHCHGNQLWFDEFARWPASVLNWDDRRTGPSLAVARQITELGFCGGISHYGALRNGTAPEVANEINDALAQAKKRLIVGPGCVIPMDCPPHLIRAARLAVEPRMRSGAA